MGRSTGVKMNWPLVVIAGALIALPMGIALVQDLGSDRDEEDLLARIGEVDEITEAEVRDQDEARGEELEEAGEIGRWHQPAMEQAFFDELFLGGPDDPGPALRGPLAGVRLGQTLEELRASAPGLAAWLAGLPPPALERARVEAVDRAGSHPGIDEIAVWFPDDGTAVRVLASRWGEPQPTTGADGRTGLAWVDRSGRLRLVIEQQDGSARATFTSAVDAR